MSDTDIAPKEISELVSFLCGFGKVAADAYIDDRRITALEVFGMIGLLREATAAFHGLEKVPQEIAALTPEQVRNLTNIPAHYFHQMIPEQHARISEAALACLPPLVTLLQTIYNSTALAAEFPGQAPKATPS